MDFLSDDGEGVFDERVRIRKRNVLSNITNRLDGVKDGGKDGDGKGASAGKGNDVSEQELLNGIGSRDVGRGKVVFKDFILDDSQEPAAGEDKAKNRGDDVLFRIQKEFEELKEMHGKTLRARRKLIKAMEKEMSEIRREMEAKQKVEIENLKKQYDEKLQEKQEAYRRICKEKILEYKRRLDEAYRAKALELKERYGAPRKKKS
ncbi:hypothetical protein PFJ87_01g01110 [Encephalitozoon hellem]|uniref:Uncharacterized protein n=1 Tax=Encephalitozoon hellem TaxID=27973 RepID=A0ABY8CLK9_ENCHE|nr:hypothetical protein PFJ87_01g01110 [Encephalitozoon hellem]